MTVLIPKHRERKRACPVGKRCKTWDDFSTITEYLLAHRKITKKGCWEWTGARNEKGYGVIRIDGFLYHTHRVALIVFSGYRGRKNALHACDNPPCFRADSEHVHPGTQSDNIKESYARGRGKGFTKYCPLPKNANRLKG